MIVTPWEVSGEIDYDKLIKKFGTERIDKKLLDRIENIAGEVHPFLKRGLFFSHRDLKWIIDEYDKGNKFFLYTGRGPSGDTHLGHLISWILTKWFQDKFGAKLYFQLTDDEKFLVKDNLTLEQTNKFAHENALDVIALGFDPKKTTIIIDTEYSKVLYKEALKVAKKITFSTVKAIFGFTNESNIGKIFFASFQIVPCFLESIKQKKNVPCLIPCGIDQDPYFRLARDVLPKLGYYKPAEIHSKFISGLGGGGKMSASIPSSTIFTTDSPNEVKTKINKTLTGGRETVELQRKLGGETEKCVIYEYLYYLFENDDKLIEERKKNCKSGKILCGECKNYLTEKINKFLKDHQEKRLKAKLIVKEFMPDL
ncbi:MAG: tryptophan--tRNA ligase [Candidatus Nanoarchaeia archaeon]